MKKTLLALSLIGCLLLSAVSCTKPEDGDIGTKEPSVSLDQIKDQNQGQKPGNPDDNKDPETTTGGNNNPSNPGGLGNAGADTNTDYGILHPVH